jgi:hypothetical protein
LKSSVYFRLVRFCVVIVHLVLAVYRLNSVSGISRPLQKTLGAKPGFYAGEEQG